MCVIVSAPLPAEPLLWDMFSLLYLLSCNPAVEQSKLIPDQLIRFNSKHSRPVSSGVVCAKCQTRQNGRKTYRKNVCILRQNKSLIFIC